MKKRTNFILLVILLTLISLVVNAQVVDDFSDGNFANNPAWVGDTDEFEVESGQLNSLGPSASSVLYLSTNNSFIRGTTWEFLIDLGFAPSGSNKLRVYLVSNQTNLEGPLNGYFIEIGQSGNDEIKFYRQDLNNIETLLFTGFSQLSGNVSIRIQVIRDCLGNWQINSDASGGSAFTSEGKSFNDNTYISTSQFGFVCFHTSSRKDLFYFDDISISSGLEIENIAIENSSSITIEFTENLEETSAETVLNYSIDNGVSVNSATLDANDHNVVSLKVSDLITSDYALTISNVADECSSTPLISLISKNFQYTQLELSSLITNSDTELQLTFNSELDESSTEMQSNYSVDNSIGQPNSATVATADPKILNLTFDNSFQALTNYTLTYGDIRNSELNSELTNGSTFNFDYVIPLVIESVEVLSKNQLKLIFNLDLDENTAEQIINYSIDNDIGNPQSASIGDTNLNEVTLSLQPDLLENNYTITINNVEDKANHPIEPNTSALFSYLPLTVSSISRVDETNIDVTFNQGLDKASAETVGNYVIDFEVGTAISAALNQTDFKIVRITFGKPFVNNDYRLTVNGLENFTGNTTAENSSSLLEVELPTSYRQIVINEIFADPTPTIGLPNSEFVELHNVSERSINIGDFELTGGTISDFILPSGGFAILASTSDAANYDTYEDVVTVSSWNTLSNGGEEIFLRDNLGNLVDSISFSDDWHESAKFDGGWTLEQINPRLACNYHANWTSSINSDGGTPGSINSIFDNSPDEVGPNLINVTVFNGDQIRLVFDEPMEAGSLASGAYSITLESDELFYSVDNSSTFSVDLVLEESLVSGNNYEIIATNVTDCAGNAILTTYFFLEYDIEPPVLERIIISSLNSIQLVFDEDLEEIEAEEEDNFDVNNDLSLPKLAILNDEDPSRLLLFFDKNFIPLLSNSITISNLQDIKGNALTSSIVTSFLYDQSIDTLLVRSINQLDLVFKDLVDEQTAVEFSNYSVSEDIGAPSLIYQDEDNDKLLHLIFENNFEDNSELTLTARNIKSTSGGYIPTPEYDFIYDTRAPIILNLSTINETTLQVDFDEKIEPKSAQSIENYYYEGVFANTRTLNQNDSTVILEFEVPFERERILELSIDNVKDLSGNAISTRIKKEFVYDIFPPELDSILAISPKALLLVFNEEIDSISASKVTNYFVEEGIGNPLSIKLDIENENQIILTFSTIFPVLVNIDISILALEDQRGNKLANSITAAFDYSQFLISKIQAVAQNQIEIEFNKSPKGTTSLEELNYSVNQGSVSEVTNPDAQNIRKFLLEVESDFEDDSQNVLAVSNLFDENDNLLSIQEYSFSFDSKFSELRIVNENTLELEFEVGLNPTELPDKSTFELISEELSPLALIIDSENNKLLRLTFSENFQSNISYSISWPQLTNEFGNLIPGFSTAFMKDEFAPEIMKIQVNSEESITIVFSEALDQKTTDIISNYELSPDSGNLEEVDYNDSDSSINLRFSQPFVDGTIYSLTINNIKDPSGNLMPKTANNFSYKAPYIPKPGELLFTEIMADPSPSVGLPESEYLEIFNNSEEEIILNKLVLSDGTGFAQLTNDTLRAKSYLLIVPASSKDLFSVDNVIGISNFPSLGNTSDSLVISLDDKMILDQVVYLDSWYRDENKNGGGYSLERLSYDDKCVTALNWIASADAQGGTPGRENSLFNTEPDKEAPKIVEISFVSSNTLEIIFSEAMDFESLKNGSYVLNNDLQIDELSPFGKEKKILTIALTENPKEGKIYELTITNVSDCAGNLIEPFIYNFGVGGKPAFNELLITEIMADPDPEVGLPQSEYLELYNASDKNLELSGLILQDENGSTELPMTIMLPKSYLLLAPSGSINLFNGIDVLVVSNWRSLSNGGETISIYDSDQLVFSTTYDQSWYKDSSKKDGGWSLEMIDLSNPCGEINNWTASEDVSGGTPGLLNSVLTNNPDNFGPQLVIAIAQNESNLKLVFDEKLNPDQFVNSSFDIEPQIGISSIYLNEPINNVALISLTDPLSPKVEYAITATGTTDCVGNFIRNEASHARFSLPELGVKGDIIINEILFNPRSGGVDFVEVYNKSEMSINLKNWQLANYKNDGAINPDIISEGDLIFQSGTFLVFTSDPIALKADYPTSDGATFIEMSSFPRYSDSNGSAILLDSLDNIIDLFDYASDFHFNLLDDVDGVSLERINFEGDTNAPSNWKSAASTAGFATPGLMNSQFKSEAQVSGMLTIEPKVFIPDNTGMNDFTTINYEFQNTGNFANVNIYDAAGRLVKTIVQGDLLSTKGFFTWDGTDNSGSRARAGYYAIYFEIFDSEGNKDMMRETVVLGVKF